MQATLRHRPIPPPHLMTTLTWIIAATVLGGVLSVIAAAIIAFNAKASHVPILISYAVGALLGAVFLEILPRRAGEETEDRQMLWDNMMRLNGK